MSIWPTTRRLTVKDLQAAKGRSERWAMLTSYDTLTAGVFEQAGVRALLVGDSAGMVVHGHSSTVPTTLDELIPLAAGVVRGTSSALVIGDLPFGSYRSSPAQALATATRYLKEAGVQAVKLEGGASVGPQVEALTEAGIPVMGHVGLMPQSINVLGGFKVQGRGDAGDRLLADAVALQSAGAFAVVLEAVPSALAERVTKELSVPTIGVGAGPHTDAQVLVWQDMVGLTPDPVPKFVKRYADLRSTLDKAVRGYVDEVEAGAFPDATTSYE